MVYRTCLENRSLARDREFESHLLRKNKEPTRFRVGSFVANLTHKSFYLVFKYPPCGGKQQGEAWMQTYLDSASIIALEKHSMRIEGHRTSVALEPQFWKELKDLAREANCSLPEYIARVWNKAPQGANGASILRVHVLLARTAK